MTDPRVEYVRVNVSSATSQSKFNIYGERIAEVDMELPSNIVSHADSIEKANMAVMKMLLPMACVPQNAVKLEDPDPMPAQIDSGYVVSKLKVGFAVGGFNTDGRFMLEMNSNFFVAPRDMQMSPVIFRTKHGMDVYRQNNWAEYEYRQGEHEIASISELLSSVNEAIRENLEINKAHENSGIPPPQIWFELAEDNSIKLKCLPRGIKSAILYSQPELLDNSHPFILRDGVAADLGDYDKMYLIANKELYELFPSLPWIPAHINFPEKAPGHYPDVCYILDSFQAHAEITNNYVRIEGNDAVQQKGAATNPASCALITYHFVTSDVMTLSNIASFVLTINGVAFNQQVYPVNFRPATVHAAQTTKVPVVETYYPILDKPSEFTSDLVVEKEAFSNAAPIKVNPLTLKDRFYKFKVWVILKDGRMKEVVIPASSTLQLQVCFELSPKAKGI